MSLSCEIVPVLVDNYSYIIHDNSLCVVVDPVDAEIVFSVVKKKNLKVAAILCTHHHWDHSGGNKALVAMSGVKDVYGNDDRIPAITCKVEHNGIYRVGKMEIKALHTPCHTKGHVLYYIKETQSDKPGLLFSGDTLFVAGCGKFFEGTASEMNHALNEIIANLPLDTLIYPGHEYTVNNLKFAQKVEPNNNDIKEVLDQAIKKRSLNKPTVPSTLSQELKTNPYMRVTNNNLIDSLKASNEDNKPLDGPVQVMAELRRRKDNSGSIISTLSFLTGMAKCYIAINKKPILMWMGITIVSAVEETINSAILDRIKVVGFVVEVVRLC